MNCIHALGSSVKYITMLWICVWLSFKGELIFQSLCLCSVLLLLMHSVVVHMRCCVVSLEMLCGLRAMLYKRDYCSRYLNVNILKRTKKKKKASGKIRERIKHPSGWWNIMNRKRERNIRFVGWRKKQWNEEKKQIFKVERGKETRHPIRWGKKADAKLDEGKK